MYVTRRLSEFKNAPSKFSAPPPRASNSGYMIIMDDEQEHEGTRCGGRSYSEQVKMLPFPQNKFLRIWDADGATDVLFIPVLDEPLSSNLYYVIHADGSNKGQACWCSTEDQDKVKCSCFGDQPPQDVKPKAFDHKDLSQRMEIRNPRSMDFYATSVLPNCNPPSFLREKKWKPTQRPCYGSFDDAPGLNSSLRMRLPEFDFPMSNKRSTPIIVGKWYSPFMFIKEEGSVKNQMKKSLFYKITLERYWEEIYSQENRGDGGDIVTVNTDIGREVYSLAGVKAERVSGHVVSFDGFMFMVRNQNIGGVGLSSALLDGMKGIQKEGGWVDGADSSVKVEKVVKMNSPWKRFCCYVLVESFVLRRMDGSTVLNCDFRHTQWIKTKCES